MNHRWNEQVMQEQQAEVWGTAALWAGVAVAAGSAVAGASAQRVATNKANDANQAAQGSINDSQWSNYLFSRGIAPTTPATPGVLPQAGQYKVVNSKLPLWMTVKSPPPPAAKKGGFLVPRA